MTYQVNAKRLTSSKKKQKQLQHQQRLADQQRTAGRRASEVLEQITEAQVDEMCLTALTNLNNHAHAILKADFPEAVHLFGIDWLLTVKQFSDAGMLGLLKRIMGQCDEELEALAGLAFLSLAKRSVLTE